MEQDMRYILEICHQRSFSKAAEALYMTQPALSVAVKRVESALGAELFDRSRHPLTLTEAGEIYLRSIRKMQDLEEDLAREIGDLRQLQKGHLRIGGTHYINCYLLAHVLAAFSQDYPGIALEVVEDSSVQLGEALKRRELDVIFSCSPELIAAFGHRPAFYDHVLLAVPENAPLSANILSLSLSAGDILTGRHLKKGCPKASLSLFRDLDFILLGEGNNLHTRGLEMFSAAGFTPRVKMTLSQMVTAFRMADNGFGATFICDRLIRTENSRLRFFELDSPLSTRLFYLLLPARQYTPFAVRTFLDYAVAKIREADLAHGRDWGLPGELKMGT